MYGSTINSVINELRDKLNTADSSREELRDTKYSIDDALNELDNYYDELESLIDSLDSMPSVEVSVSIDVTFNSED